MTRRGFAVGGVTAFVAGGARAVLHGREEIVPLVPSRLRPKPILICGNRLATNPDTVRCMRLRIISAWVGPSSGWSKA